MKILKSFGNEELARVFIAEFSDGRLVECVESLQPPVPREEKWVLIISTSFGCPVKCMMCDAGGYHHGNLSAAQILEQVDYLVRARYPDGKVPAKKFKVQFARMGEPSFNWNVLSVLEALPGRYEAPGLMPCISTIAPSGTEDFFKELRYLKNRLFAQGKFQLQFSIHSTDEAARDRLVPVRKWPLSAVSEFGREFYVAGDRKIALNFALARGITLDAQKVREIFHPDYFMVKITPLNPTYRAMENGLATYISAVDFSREYEVAEALKRRGFDTLISIGQNEENLIGSNCGQYLQRHFDADCKLPDSYTYVLPS